MRALALILALLLPLAAAAQDRAQTLADIRSELGAIGAEIASLRAEMLSSGAVARFGGASALERMDALEAALTALTARAEALELRLDRIVADATNRLADLEFRLTELEGGDVAGLGQPAPLGTTPSAGSAPATPGPAPGPQASVDRAREVLGQRDFRGALALLEAAPQPDAGDPLGGEAAYLRGQALEGLGDTAAAARAYLESFSGWPDGIDAPMALFRLGLALGTLGQRPEACVTLGEVGARYPLHAAAAEAAAAASALGCG